MEINEWFVNQFPEGVVINLGIPPYWDDISYKVKPNTTPYKPMKIITNQQNSVQSFNNNEKNTLLDKLYYIRGKFYFRINHSFQLKEIK